MYSQQVWRSLFIWFNTHFQPFEPIITHAQHKHIGPAFYSIFPPLCVCADERKHRNVRKQCSESPSMYMFVVIGSATYKQHYIKFIYMYWISILVSFHCCYQTFVTIVVTRPFKLWCHKMAFERCAKKLKYNYVHWEVISIHRGEFQTLTTSGTVWRGSNEEQWGFEAPLGTSALGSGSRARVFFWNNSWTLWAMRMKF